ncbi:RNA-directed DNA polymerase, eukaryota [Tanacetum coccineum]
MRSEMVVYGAAVVVGVDVMRRLSDGVRLWWFGDGGCEGGGVAAMDVRRMMEVAAVEMVAVRRCCGSGVMAMRGVGCGDGMTAGYGGGAAVGTILFEQLDSGDGLFQEMGNFRCLQLGALLMTILEVVRPKTRWIKYVPIKVNILAWRIKLDYLPTRLNLSRRGIDLESILCASCNSAVESPSHIFFACSMVKDLYKNMALRGGMPIGTELSSYEEWWNWFSNLRFPSKLKMIFKGVFYITWWLV